jgi:hypothetical protein
VIQRWPLRDKPERELEGGEDGARPWRGTSRELRASMASWASSTGRTESRGATASCHDRAGNGGCRVGDHALRVVAQDGGKVSYVRRL